MRVRAPRARPHARVRMRAHTSSHALSPPVPPAPWSCPPAPPRYERLEEDLDGALQLINLRRPQGMPPIVIQVRQRRGRAGAMVLERGVQGGRRGEGG